LNVERAIGVGPVTIAARPAATGSARSMTTIAAASSDGHGISGAEFFLDAAGAPGHGVKMKPAGAWGAHSVHSSFALNTRSLPAGAHSVFVHARNAAGVWGPASVQTLVIDRTPPAVPTFKMNRSVVMPPDRAARLNITVSDALSRMVTMTIRFVDAQGRAWITKRYDVPPATYDAPWQGTTDAPGSKSFNGEALPPGQYTIESIVLDEAANEATATTSVVVGPKA